MRRKQFQLRNYIIATSVFITAVVIGILIFFTCVQQAVEVNSQEIMMTDVSRQSEHMRTILDIHYQYLNEIASEMGKSDQLFSEENKERLVFLHEQTELERMALIDNAGNAYYDNGVSKNVEHRSFLYNKKRRR